MRDFDAPSEFRLRPADGGPLRTRRPEGRGKAEDGNGPTGGLGRAVLGLLVGLVAPAALYYGLRAAGVGAYLALIAGAVAPALGAAVGLVRGRKVDGVVAFFAAMTLLGLGLSLVGGGPRFLLAREGFVTGIAGAWFLASAPTVRPLALAFSRPVLEGLLRYGHGRWDNLWEREPRFRRVWRVSTVIFGAGLLADAAARVAMAYALPVDVVPALGAALYAVASVLLLGVVNVYQARSGLWPMLLGMSEPLPANRTVRRLLHPIHRMSSGRGG